MIYKVRVILDSKNTVFRDIEIKEKQTLWNLHLAIKSAFSLQGEELSSFYVSDDEWSEGESIPLEDLSDDGDGETMSDIYISEAFPKKGAKMLFKYGLIDLSEFFCELMETSEEKSGVTYPRISYRFGNLSIKSSHKSSETQTEPVLEEDEDEDIDDLDSDYTESEEDVFDDFDDIEDSDSDEI